MLSLLAQHFMILRGIAGWMERATAEIVQPVTTDEVQEAHERTAPSNNQHGKRAIRNMIDDLKLTGLIETWVESRGREGRVKQVETTFNPKLVRDTENKYIAETPTVKRRD